MASIDGGWDFGVTVMMEREMMRKNGKGMGRMIDVG
jgi:hypothetical protein